MQPVTIDFKGYTITTDKSLMKVNDIHKWLSEESYWAKNVAFETFKMAFDHSFCIGAIIDGMQIGFGRLITDYATFGYLADVYVEEPYRGQGISKKMMEIILAPDWVKGMRAIRLATSDAHGLYKQFGFTESKHPERLMELSLKPLNP